MTETEATTVRRGEAYEDLIRTKGWEELDGFLRLMLSECYDKFSASARYDIEAVNATLELRGRAKTLRLILDHVRDTIRSKDSLLGLSKEAVTHG